MGLDNLLQVHVLVWNPQPGCYGWDTLAPGADRFQPSVNAIIDRTVEEDACHSVATALEKVLMVRESGRPGGTLLKHT
jgi:hypothetical protein